MAKKIILYDDNITAEMIEQHMITEMTPSQICKNNKMLFHLKLVSKGYH